MYKPWPLQIFQTTSQSLTPSWPKLSPTRKTVALDCQNRAAVPGVPYQTLKSAKSMVHWATDCPSIPPGPVSPLNPPRVAAPELTVLVSCLGNLNVSPVWDLCSVSVCLKMIRPGTWKAKEYAERWYVSSCRKKADPCEWILPWKNVNVCVMFKKRVWSSIPAHVWSYQPRRKGSHPSIA